LTIPLEAKCLEGFDELFIFAWNAALLIEIVNAQMPLTLMMSGF
jgi:hypothetical protein